MVIFTVWYPPTPDNGHQHWTPTPDTDTGHRHRHQRFNIFYCNDESRRVPTHELIYNNFSSEDIRGQNMIDNTMYAVVHTATSYVS